MRTSKKDQLIQTALEIIEHDGLGALTYDSLAAATGVSKSGLIYHFPSRNHLILELNRHCAAQWVRRLEEIAGGTVEEVSLYDRLRALLQVHVELSSRADLILTIDAMEHPELKAAWDEEFSAWLIPAAEAGSDAFTVQIIADGLWLHNYVNGDDLSPEQTQAALRNALELVDYMEARAQ